MQPRLPRIWTPEAKTTDGTLPTSELFVVALLAEYGDWWRSAAPSWERNAEEGPVLLGVPVISFPCSPISLKERSLKGVSVFSVLLGLFGSLRAPVSGLEILW